MQLGLGAFQSLFNKTNVFEIRIDRDRCSDCGRCVRACPTFSIDMASLAAGGTRISCSKCGKCVDECPKGAAAFHLKGTAFALGRRCARLLFLYPAFLFLITLHGRAIQDTLQRLMRLAVTGSLLRQGGGDVFKVRFWLAHTWAFLATPIVLATFIGTPYLSRALAGTSGARVSPWFVGGEIVREVRHRGYKTMLHRPVFDGLIGQRAEGFVLIEWQPLDGGALPPHVIETIDSDGDGNAEFRVDLDVHALRAQLTAESPLVLGLEHVYDLDPARAIRVRLRRARGRQALPASCDTRSRV